MKQCNTKKWESKQAFKNEVYLYAQKLDVSIKQVVMRSMANKWASCSTTGYFTFNIDLLDMDRSLGRYVILHELLHFFAPNHGKLWKSLMTLYMPNHEKNAKRLKAFYLSHSEHR